jgi:DNA polymerase
MRTYTLDFETFYAKDFSLTKLTYDEYINDPRFEVIGVGVQVNDGQPKWFSGDYDATKKALDALDLENNAVIMHNAMFDAAILAFHFGIKPKIIFDTLSMARALHNMNVGNSLSKLATHYGIGEKGTEVYNFIGYARADFTPEELAAYGAYCKQDVNLTRQLFAVMYPHFNMTELKLIDMTIRMYTEPSLQYDRAFLTNHLENVKAAQQKFLDDLNLTATELRSNPKFADLLRAQGVEPPTKLNSKGIETYAFAKTDEGLQELLEHENPMVQALVSARLGVKTSIEATRTEGMIATGDRCKGKIPVGLLYYGARSGRFSATQALNLQNVPRDSEIKKGLTAPEGHVIVGLDLSNIELRVGLWFAGQHDKMRLLQEGVDLYKDFAANVFNVPYAEVTKEQRFIGKTSQLSLIYGVGAGKLQQAVKTGSGVDMGEIEAKRIVSLYREEYHHVAALWDTGKQAISALVDDYALPFGFNDICMVEGSIGIKLPSGLYMQYPNLRQQHGDTGKKEWVYDKNSRMVDRLYGAKVMQNLCQALARCVIGEAMVRIHAKYPICLTVHDSLYSIVSEEHAQAAYDFMLDELTKTPTWLPGIILAAEGGWGRTLKDV